MGFRLDEGRPVAIVGVGAEARFSRTLSFLPRAVNRPRMLEITANDEYCLT